MSDGPDMSPRVMVAILLALAALFIAASWRF
jgi:preprotein translocase subunit Sec61beta